MSRRSYDPAQVVPAPVLRCRTDHELARADRLAGEWLPGRREEVLARHQRLRSDPVFRMLEEIAEDHCHVPGLGELGADRLDFHDVFGPGLADALRAAFLLGLQAGKGEV